VRIMTPSITACPPTIKSLSFVLNVWFPVGQAFLPVVSSVGFRGQTGMSILQTLTPACFRVQPLGGF
jgi:hypothetical protein